ncbi:MAG: radical SAM protein [Nitrospirota bacterium]|nr:radical SAM protein [Nitrospirota bacterium]
MIGRRLIKKTEALLGKEEGTVYKDPGGRVNVCLVYPNTYHVGMSSLGFQGIYSILNSRDDTVCERAFLPDESDLIEFERTGSELFSLESKRPLSRFDIVAFSVSFENDYPSIPLMLRLARIGAFSSGRKEREPLLLLGGVCAMFNPEPLSDFFDLIFIGEADGSLDELIEEYKGSEDKGSFLRAISEKEGFYVPGRYEIIYSDDGKIKERRTTGAFPRTIRKRTERVLNGRLRPAITTPETEFSNMYLIEAMRGCVWSCRFCVAGHIYNPPRHKDIGILKQEIDLAMETTGRVGLIGPSLTDYRYAIEALQIEGVDFSITSLRATPKAEKLLSLMKGHRSISIAPEAGTERLRRIINKRITEEDIMETAELILRHDIQTLRLYFMIGLPFETEEDINGIIDLAKKIRSLNTRGTIVLSTSTFVPKPFTPFQWHPMTAEKTIKARLKMIKSGLNIKGIRVFHDVIKYAFMQGVFSRGDRRLSRVLHDMKEHGRWKESTRNAGVDPDFYLFRERMFEEILPWDFIDAGISKEALWGEYMKARESAGLH